MRRLLISYFLSFSIVYLHAQEQIGVNPPSLKWSKMETPAGEIIYPRGMDSTALNIAYRMHSASLFDTSEVLLHKSTKPIPTIIQNQSVFPAGYATTAPWRQELYLTPPQNLFMGPSLWQDALTTHEYRHAQQFMAYNKGWTYLYKALLGNTGWLLTSVIDLPLWYREGDAVDSETRFSNGGRGKLPAFHMEYRTLLLNDVNFSYEKAVSTFNFKDFVPNVYRSGYYMTRRLRQQYGDTAWAHVVHQSSKKIFYPFTRSLRNFTGESTPLYYASTFNQLDSIWHASDTVTNIVGIKISDSTNIFEKHRFPQKSASGELIVSHFSLKNIRGFYKMKEDGSLKKIKSAGIYTTDHENFVVEGNVMTWAEAAYHPRYLNKDYSVIKYKDLETGKIWQMSHRSKYFSPAPSKNGDEVAIIAYDEKGDCSVKIIEVATKDVTNSFNHNNWFLTQPRWINNEDLVLVATSDKGSHLLLLNTSSGKWRELLAGKDINIAKPFGYKNNIYFSSGLTGIENIFCINLDSEKITQITNARFGAFDPSVYQDTLYFSNYGRYGYEVWKAHLSEALNKPVTFPKEPAASPLPEYYETLAKQAILPEITIDTTFNSFFFKKLFYSYGWFPLVFPPELGAEFYTLNLERTFKSTIGVSYNLNENIIQTRFTGSYAKFFPIINATFSNRARRLQQSLPFYDIDSITEFRTTEQIIGGGIELPFRLTQGVYNTSLTLKGDFNHHIIEQLEANGNGDLEFNSVNTSFAFTRMRPTAKRHVKTRFGQAIQGHYKYGLETGDPIQLYANGQFYFPGLCRTHSLNFRGEYEQNQNSGVYEYLSIFRGPRGYRYYPFEESYLISGNYELPLFYPDIYLRAIAGITRVRFNAFFDYSAGNTLDFEQQRSSVGGEIIFDIRLLRAFNMDMKLQFIQRLNPAPSQQPFTFGFAVDYFELLN